MRGNESGGEDGWQQPHEDLTGWAPRDADQADQAPGTPAAGIGDQQTIAFGVPGHDDGPGSGEPHYTDDPWYGGDPGQAGYGGRGEGQGYSQGGRYGGFGGYGSGGWEPPAPPPPRRPGRHRRFGVYLAVAALAAGIGAAATVVLDHHDAAPASGVSPSNIAVPSGRAARSGSSSGLDQASVEAKVSPGLVDITATLKYASETAEGTGMVVNPDGLVLTNNHVIDGATSVSVTLADSGTSYRARIVGYDSVHDVALLQLSGAANLATVSFGNSSQVKLGAAVLALGNAEGRGTVTPAAGTIDGLNRSIQASDQGSDTTEDLNHMLQTNAQIQQGDSGGALANSAGQVIGMVTAANTGQGGQQAGPAGFAIPINSALAIASQIAEGRASSTVYIGLPGFLGVEVAQSKSPNPRQQAADARQATRGQGGQGGQGGPGGAATACVRAGQAPSTPTRIAPAGSGALVLGVVCRGAADTGGLVPGDVITSVNGQAVSTPGSLTTITSRYHPGDVVTVAWQSINGARHITRLMLGYGPAR
jgi:S1-C subfamily serine protease